MKAQKPRGQALALMSLTMLLLVLMVCVTLSFSMRVREKMETQSVADLAAYSSAVATARTFNSIALMNRALNAELVALTANNSLISWTSMVRASLLAAKASLEGCAPASVVEALEEADEEIQEQWDKRDAEAGVQGYNLHQTAWFLSSQGGIMLNEQLMQAVDGGPKSFATQLATMATEGSRFPGELKGGPTAVSTGELIAAQGGNPYAREMAMATRGYDFITRRLVTPPIKNPGGVADGIEGLEITTTPRGAGGGSGSTFWGDSDKGNDPGHGASGKVLGSTKFLIAEDHATVTVSYPGCPTVTRNARATVRSTDRNDKTDDHNWSIDGEADKDDPGEEKEFRHTLLPCDNPKFCPNVFAAGPSFNNANFNFPVASDGNIWFQPKLFSLVQRDYKVRQAAGALADPWLLRFDFHFSASRTSTFDNRGLMTADGTDISVQSALASGLAYYHRRGRWREPPNLWNPFWRATLVSVDIDDSGKAPGAAGDVGKTVGAPGGAAFDALIAAGYKGAH